MAFGAVAIDQVGPVRPYPAASMLAGLIGNALGWDWSWRTDHQALQDRLIFGVAEIRPGEVVTDIQNVQMAKADKGWTTLGRPEGRAGASYDARHRRTRDYHADRAVRVVLALNPPDQAPTLDDVRVALLYPARPLFLGRKACLPSRSILPAEGWAIEAPDAHAALTATAPGADAQWPVGEGPMDGPDIHRIGDLPDLRVWTLGLHGGSRAVVEGRLPEAPE